MQTSKYQNTRVVSGEVQRGGRVPGGRQRWMAERRGWARWRWLRSEDMCRRSLHCWQE